MWILLAIFGATYILIASEKVDKSIAAFIGAALVIGLHYIPYDVALSHVDLNVIFLILGMMIIVNVFAKTGLFEWIAMTVSKRARGNGLLIILQLLVITAVFSSVLDNVTTVILIAPITILITQILEIPTIPVLILECIFSNIGGTATLVGDPPNIIIGSSVKLTFNDFLLNLGPVVLIIMLVSLVVIYFAIRKKAVVTDLARSRILKSHPALAIVDKKNLKVSLTIFSFVLVGFFLGRIIGAPPGVVALSGGLLMVYFCKSDLRDVLGKVEWTTIIFFIGLFMLIGALQENGIFEILGGRVIALTRGNLLLTALVVMWASAFISAIVDNIPLVIAVVPLIQSVVPVFADQMGITNDPALVNSMIKEPLAWSLALGACLGGNGSLIGASANVVISQIAKKNNYPLTFWRFTRIGLPMMILSLVISTIYVYLRYFMTR